MEMVEVRSWKKDIPYLIALGVLISLLFGCATAGPSWQQASEVYGDFHKDRLGQKYISVSGEVRRSMHIYWAGGMSVYDVLVGAGWVTKDANIRTVRILRGEQKLLVNVEKLLAGDERQDIVLMPGDIIHVDTAPHAVIGRLIGGLVGIGAQAASVAAD